MKPVLNKRSIHLIGLLVALTSITSFVVWGLIPSEPGYQGRRLSEWLRDFDHDKAERRGMATIAVRHIGPEALPFLLDRLEHPRPTLRRESRLRQWQRQLLEWLGNHTPVKISAARPTDPRLEALAGLDALGPAAKDALPALEKLLSENPPDPHALYVVARIGQAGVPLLTKSLSNTSSQESKLLRLEARACLEMMKSHSETLYPKVELGSDCAHFTRRICEFNQKVLSAASQEYRAQHPEMDLPKRAFDTPPSLLPP